MMTIEAGAQQAQRIERTATFTVHSEVKNVFPLFGPIREKEWCFGWNPEVIYSTHPHAELRMIFKTKGKHADEPEYLWMITQYQPENYRIEYSVSTSNRVWFITVHCEAAKHETNVTVAYSYTGLNSLGNERNKEMLEHMFANNLKDWETAIDHYLRTGTIME